MFETFAYPRVDVRTGGLEVYPRLVGTDYPVIEVEAALPSGDARLDSLTGGGLDRGSSNIFVGLETMPPWLQAIVRHNPVTHLTDASRGLMHGTAVTEDVLWVLIASAVIVAISAPIAMRMYHQER